MCLAQDPTGTVGAGVSARVLEREPDLAPGAVLVLQDVGVLRLGRVPYLAITPANVTKVEPTIRCGIRASDVRLSYLALPPHWPYGQTLPLR